jgi:choline dehydrogenase-like flavoprotein
MRTRSFRSLLGYLLLSQLGQALGRLYDQAEELPSLSWDFIIVGGGTSGSVIANRLSENELYNVLLVEAGPSNEGVVNSTVPFMAWYLSDKTPYDWNYTTVAQSYVDDRLLPFPRGHVLGGSSSTNFMVYTRGSSDDYDGFAKATGDQGWNWNSMLTYFKKNERWIDSPTLSCKPGSLPDDNSQVRLDINSENALGLTWTGPESSNCTLKHDPSVHGSDGYTHVSNPEIISPVNHVVASAAEDPQSELRNNPDMNSGSPLGLAWMQLTVSNGLRSSAATSYLGKSFMDRPNLHVVVNTQAKRVLGSKDALHIDQVELLSKTSGSTVMLKASKEIILSAGSIGSPNILMHSGIGPAKTLQEHGIPVLHDLPHVGHNLSDHLIFALIWKTNSRETMEAFTKNATRFQELVALWTETRTGHLAQSYTNQVGWYRLPEDSAIYETEEDPSSGPKTPQLEFIFVDGALPFIPTPDGYYFSVNVALLTPSSAGTVSIGGSDPLSPPIIDPQYISTKFDQYTLREGARVAQRFANLPAFKEYDFKPANFDPEWSDAELDAFIRASVATVFHPTGTCKASPKGASYGVVDPDLLVKGVKGLRVVDASIFPFIVSAHTQAPVYAVAERAADLIKRHWA